MNDECAVRLAPRARGPSIALVLALGLLLSNTCLALSVLVFSKVATGAFRHSAIPGGIAAIREICAAKGWQVDDTEDASTFAHDGLSRYDVIVWNNTGGNVLDEAGRAGFAEFIHRGGGYVGIHMAVAGARATEGGWEWYARLVGAQFKHHPPGTPPAYLRVEAGPLMVGLPNPWRHADEWYEWDKDPRGDSAVEILLAVDESSYGVGDGFHSVAWCHDFEGGRAFYTALGHTEESFSEDGFRRLLSAGIEWAGARSPNLSGPKIGTDGLLVDLDADRGLSLEDGDKVSAWKNQVRGLVAQEFVKRDEGRATAGSGRPILRRSLAALNGHNSLSFHESELVNVEDGVFDRLITGKGYTWLVVMAPYAQAGKVPGVHAFLGNLKNSSQYEGFWAGLDDDNGLWAGSRNGITFGRFDSNNPKVIGPRLQRDRYYVVAGRMGAGVGAVSAEVFVDTASPAGSQTFFVNPAAKSSRLAIGQERDATNHPGAESFDGELARVLVYARPLSDAELLSAINTLKIGYLREGR